MCSKNPCQIVKEGAVRKYGESAFFLGAKIVKWTDFHARLRSDATLELYKKFYDPTPFMAIQLSKASAVRIPGIHIHTKEMDMKFLCQDTHNKTLPAAVARKKHKLLHVIVDPEAVKVHMLVFDGDEEEIHDWFHKITLVMLENHAGRKSSIVQQLGQKIGSAIKSRIAALSNKNSTEQKIPNLRRCQSESQSQWQQGSSNQNLPHQQANLDGNKFLKVACRFAPIVGATASVGGFIYTILQHADS